jgi:hypothetical protein
MRTKFNNIEKYKTISTNAKYCNEYNKEPKNTANAANDKKLKNSELARKPIAFDNVDNNLLFLESEQRTSQVSFAKESTTKRVTVSSFLISPPPPHLNTGRELLKRIEGILDKFC